MRKINSALLSYGMSGRVFHAPFIHLLPEFNLIGSWERSEKRIQDDYPDAASYDSMQSLLQDDRIELVVVNTPTYTHFEYAKNALEAGKHVIVEKAFCANAAEAIELRRLARIKGLKLAVFQNRRWDSDFKTVRKILEEGVLGDVVEASISFARYKPELSPKTHKELQGPGGGIIKDLGAHVIDQALTLFGQPESVYADIRVTRKESQVDDYFDILLQYPDKSVHAKGGYFFLEPTPEFVLHGTLGSFLKSRSDVQEAQLDSGMKPDHPDYGTEPEEHQGLLHFMSEGRAIRKSVPTEKGNYAEFYLRMFESIVKNIEEPVSPLEGVQSMSVIDAAFKSNLEGRKITL